MLTALRVLAQVDLDGIAGVVSEVHTVAPFVDPTAYAAALRGDMDAVADAAKALLPAVDVYREKIEAKLAAAET